MKKIVLTGGGTAGHVTPNIALLPALQAAGYEIAYVGSYEGIEKKLIADFNIPYTGISTGKFRRYLDPKNFSDPFRVMKGFVEARNYLKNYQPDVVFSKGGFVSVPVVRAAASLHIPCIIHESDMTPGLANKLCIPVAEKVCCNFPETMKNIPADKAVLTGSPIRAELAQGSRLAGLNMCGFTANKPVIMVIGGSLGAANVNKAVRDALPKLLEDFQVVHLCGKDKIDNLLLNTPGYKQFEYISIINPSHRIYSSVPAVKIANHADSDCPRHIHTERHTGNSVHRDLSSPKHFLHMESGLHIIIAINDFHDHLRINAVTK